MRILVGLIEVRVETIPDIAAVDISVAEFD